MKLKKWQLPLTLVFFITGILLMSALRTLASSEQTPWRQKNETLVAMIEAQEKELKDMEELIETKRKSLDDYQKTLTAGKAEAEILQKKLVQLKILSGMIEVQGPGIIIYLDDNKKNAETAESKKPEQFKPEDFLIHDKHLLYIVNELRVGGAESISINGQRIIGSSDIRCVGPMILVNTTRLAPPYIIKAIGDADRMTKILEYPESEYNILKMAGYPVQLERQDRIIIEPYKGSYQFTYAQPKEES
jgi:uncharacterized protein YlxW (UPF0749 family)